MLTVVLRHDQSRPNPDLQAQLVRQGFLRDFPPPGIEIVSWVVAMGLGQIVTLRFPSDRLREVNRILEATAWGAFRTEIYATYDFAPIARQLREEHAPRTEP